MGTEVTRSNWSKGANNRASSKRLPDGFYRDSVNLDPNPDGTLQLRAGYEKVLAGTDVRGGLSVGTKILLADGTSLIEYDTVANRSATLATIAGTGQFAGDVLNSELFLCTANQCFRYANELRRWGVPTVFQQPAVAVAAGGGIAAGTYLYAATITNAYGEEGGTAAAAKLTVTDFSTLTFTLPAVGAGETVNLYMTDHDSTTLYHQASGTGTLVLSQTHDLSRTLETQFYQEPPPGHLVAAYNGCLLIAAGTGVVFTQPMRPHLYRPSRSFLQYPVRPTVMAAVRDGVYIVSDHTYFVTGIETGEPQQRIVRPAGATDGLQVGAVAGSQTRLSDDSVYWMTEYGPVIASNGGQIRFVTEGHYVPQLASQGASGMVERNGNQLVVTSMKGLSAGNNLAATDFIEAEIVYP